MQVSPDVAYITQQHISAINNICGRQNTFVFIRLGTRQTMDLIAQGYATKSMDVHDKSSDWGPMAGFVPCDPAFSKKRVGQANPNIKAKVHDHAQALVMQLELTEQLATPPGIGGIVHVQHPASSAARRYVKFRSNSSGVNSTIFMLEKNGARWLVSWLDRSGKACPLYVWGYKINGEPRPVTGDYDLWMVAPHISSWSQHTRMMVIQDEHGESGATLFVADLLKNLNIACGRADNHVFHHGAEAQNYGFTQALDQQLVMFTPCGSSQMVSQSRLPNILHDLEVAGYLVHWNKRYGEPDPHLSGNPIRAGVSNGERGDPLRALQREAAEVEQRNAGTALGQGNIPKLIRKNLLGQGEEVLKIEEIRAFSEQMKIVLADLESDRMALRLKDLRPLKDIPEQALRSAKGDLNGLHLQRRWQTAMAELSELYYGNTLKASPTGELRGGPTGATRPPSAIKLNVWHAKHANLFADMRQQFGDAGSVFSRYEQIPGTRAFRKVAMPGIFRELEAERQNRATAKLSFDSFVGMIDSMRR